MQKKGKLRLSGTKILRDKLSRKQTPHKNFVSIDKKIQNPKNEKQKVSEKSLKTNTAVRSKGPKGLYKTKPTEGLQKYVRYKTNKKKVKRKRLGVPKKLLVKSNGLTSRKIKILKDKIKILPAGQDNKSLSEKIKIAPEKILKAPPKKKTKKLATKGIK